MSRRPAAVALVALALLQLAVPLRMIGKRQETLRSGELFRFRAAPVDPYDAFRGRYVALRMAADEIAVANAADYLRGQKIFVLLATDEAGFARPSGVSRRRPRDVAYVEARVAPWRRAPGKVSIQYPFDRYYMTEELAPAAERIYRERSAGEESEAWIAVRINDGFAVLEELYIGDRPIGEILKGGG